MQIRLKIWRQENRAKQGRLVDYDLPNVEPDMSFLEMLDMLNERLVCQRERPGEIDHDYREGICGQRGEIIKGKANGPLSYTTTLSLLMCTYQHTQTSHLKPF